MATTFDTVEELGLWINVSPRSASGRVVGFIMRDTDTASSILDDVKKKLDLLSDKIPAFAGQLQLGEYLTADQKQRLLVSTSMTGTQSQVRNGDVYLLKSSQFKIGLRVCYPKELQELYKHEFPAEDEAHGIDFMPEYVDYAKLKEDGFPVEAFIGNKDLTNGPYHEGQRLDPFF